jgi:sensor c-di-GMP phosphodiesterase-like protein
MFIDSLGTDRHSNTIIETLIDLATNMRMDVIAEGVESFEQVVHLRELGIRAAQGFVFSPPLPASAFLQLVQTIDPLKASSARPADAVADAITSLARIDAA